MRKTKLFGFAAIALFLVSAVLLIGCPEEPGTTTPTETEYTVNVTQPTGGGSISVNPTKAKEGATVTVTVTPPTGQELDVLTVKQGSTTVTVSSGNSANVKTFVMPKGDVTVSATFKTSATGYNITVTQPDSGGTIAADKTTASQGQEVVLTATPATGYHLGSFTVTAAGGTNVTLTDGATANSKKFTMPAANVTVTATFVSDTATKYAITATQSTGGTFTVSATEAAENETVTLVATPAATHDFGSFEVKQGATTIQLESGSGSTRTFKMPAGAVTVTATWVEKGATQYTVTVTSASNGTVTANPTSAAAGVTVTLTIAPSTGYRIKTLAITGVAAENIGGTGNTRTFTMPASNVTVTYEMEAIPATYTVTITTPTNGTVTADKTTDVTAGDTVTLTITATTGYSLDTITAVAGTTNVDITGTGNSRTFTMPAGNVTVTAVFKGNDQTITVNQSTGGSFTVNGASTATVTAATGATVTLVATADTGYTFGSFTVTGATLASGTGTTRTFTMPAAGVTVTAVWNAQSFAINIPEPIGGEVKATVGGSSTAVTTAAVGVTVTLTATPDQYYEWKSYSVMQGSTTVELSGTTAGVRTFTMPAGAVTVTAVFDSTIPMSVVTFKGITDGAPKLDHHVTVRTDVDSIGEHFPQDPVKADTADKYYVFNGWYASTDTAKADKYTKDKIITVATVDLVADFTEIARTFNVKYGTPGMNANIVDALWDDPELEIYPIAKVFVADSPSADFIANPDTWGVAKLLWDEDNLYVYVKVTDPVVTPSPADQHWLSDSVEVLVYENMEGQASHPTANDNKGYGNYGAQNRINAGGATVTGDPGNGTTATTVNRSGRAWAVDGGYIALLQYGWRQKGAPNWIKQHGRKFGFEIAINTANVGGTRLGSMRWRDNTNGMYNDKTAAVNNPMTLVNPNHEYTITYNAAPANGTVSVDKSAAKLGETVTITVAPETNRVVESITVTGVASSDITKVNNTTYTFAMPASNVTIAVVFDYPDGFGLIEVSVSPDAKFTGFPSLIELSRSTFGKTSATFTLTGTYEKIVWEMDGVAVKTSGATIAESDKQYDVNANSLTVGNHYLTAVVTIKGVKYSSPIVKITVER